MKKVKDQPQKFPKLTPEEKLKIENEFLKCKLTAEFGMEGAQIEDIPPEVENQWLKNIYEFEKQFKDSKQVKIYEAIGKPGFTNAEELSDENISVELKRLRDLLDQNNLVLDLLCEYDDRTIYKFITKELFKEEIDDIRIPGMKTCFVYEEFHPNHGYDIKRLIDKSFKFLLANEGWNDEFCKHFFSETIDYKGKKVDNADFVKMLVEFREEVMPFGLDLLEFYSVSFDLEKRSGSANGAVHFTVLEDDLPGGQFNGEFKVNVTRNVFGFWEISEFGFPGFQ